MVVATAPRHVQPAHVVCKRCCGYWRGCAAAVATGSCAGRTAAARPHHIAAACPHYDRELEPRRQICQQHRQRRHVARPATSTSMPSAAHAAQRHQHHAAQRGDGAAHDLITGCRGAARTQWHASPAVALTATAGPEERVARSAGATRQVNMEQRNASRRSSPRTACLPVQKRAARQCAEVSKQTHPQDDGVAPCTHKRARRASCIQGHDICGLTCAA